MKSSLLDLAYKLNSFNNNFINRKLKIIDSNKVKSNNFDFLQLFLLNKEFNNLKHRDFLLNYFLNAEKTYPGLSFLVSVLLVRKILNKEKNYEIIAEEKNIETLKKYFYKKAKKSIVDNFLSIVNFSGPDASLNCKITDSSEFTVKKRNNPTFKNIYIKSELLNVYFSNVKEATKSVQMSILDGFIERESEIMPIIEKAKENKVAALIICRGISDTALQFIKKIVVRNNIHVYIYEAKFDNNDPFLIDDISEITEINKISSDTCDNIYKEISKKTKIIKVKLKPNSIEFFNSSKKLIDKINKSITLNEGNYDLLKYLHFRKKRVTPNNIDINVPKEMYGDFKVYKKLIVCYNFCAVKGFSKLDNKIFSSFEIESAMSFSKNLFNSLKNIGLVVKNEK